MQNNSKLASKGTKKPKSSPKLAENSEDFENKRKIRIFLAYMNNVSYSSEIFISSGEKDFTKMEIINTLLPESVRSLFKRSYNYDEYDAELYKEDILVSDQGQEIHFSNKTKQTMTSYTYPSHESFFLGVDKERTVHFCFGTQFKRLETMFYQDPPFASVDDSLTELYLYFAGIVKEPVSFEDNLVQLFQDFENYTPNWKRNNTNFTERLIKMVFLSLTSESFEYPKASELILLQLITVEILPSSGKDRSGKDFRELALKILPNHDKIGQFNCKELKENFHKAMVKFLAMFVLNFSEELLNVPLPLAQHVFEIISGLSEVSLASLKTYAKDNIIRIFADASKNWKEEVKAKLCFFIAEQAETTTSILYLQGLIPGQSIFQNSVLFETFLKKLIEENKGDTLKASTQADQNFVNLFSQEDLLSIQQKLFFRGKSLLEIEFLFARITNPKNQSPNLAFLQTATPFIQDVLEKMPLLGILTELIMASNIKIFANDLIYQETIKKINRLELVGFKYYAEKLLNIFPIYPQIVEEVFRILFKSIKTKSDMTNILFPIVVSFHPVLASESSDYWPKGIEQAVLHPVVQKIMELTKIDTETLTLFEKFIEMTPNIEKKKICFKFWISFSNRYGCEGLLSNYKHVVSSLLDPLKAAYKDSVLENIGKKLKAQDLDKIFTQIYGKGAKELSLEGPFSDEIITNLTERLVVTENIFDVLSKPEESQAWIWLISFQGGSMFKGANKYLQIQQLLKDLIYKMTSLQVTFDEAKIISAISEDRFKDLQNNLLLHLDPKQATIASYQTIKTQSKIGQDVLKKLAGFIECSLSIATNFGEMMGSFALFASKVPSILLKDYRLPDEYQVYYSLAEDVDQIRSSVNFQIFYNQNVKQNVKYTSEELIANLKTAIEETKNIKNNLEGEKPLMVEYIENLFLKIGKERRNQELEILANYLTLKEETVSSVREFLAIHEKKWLYMQNAQALEELAEMVGLQQDEMIVVLNCNSKILEKTGANIIEVRQTFHQMHNLASKYFENDDLMAFLKIFVDVKELNAFVIEKEENDIRAMIEMLDDYGSSLIKTTDVAYLLDLLPLFKWFKDQKPSQIKVFLNEVVVKLKEQRYKGILEKIKICNGHLCTLSQLTNKGEASKSIVRNLANGGVVEFFLTNKAYSSQLRALARDRAIDILEAIEIRDRLHLTLKSAETKIFGEEDVENEEQKKPEGKRDMNGFQNFINIIDCIEAIVISLRGLHRKGSSDLEERYTFNFDLETLEAEKRKFEENERIWNSTLEKAYTNYHALTFIYGRQFVKLSRYLARKDSNREALYLIQFIFDNKVKDPELGEIDPEFNIYQLDHLGIHLQKKYTEFINTIQRQPIVIDNKVQNSKMIIPTLSEKIIETACTIRLERGYSLPNARNCLNCSKETCLEEIHAFLKRYIHCSGRELFLIIGVEELIEDVQDLFIKLLANYLNLYGTEMQIMAEMAFITCRSDATVINELLNIGFAQHSQKSYDQETLSKHLQSLTQNIEVVTSSDSGYGKSQFVKDQKGTQIHFPITGAVNRNKITERLIELKIDNDSILHFDIGYLSEEGYREVNGILFSILVLGGLFTFENIFMVPMKCRIFVEVQEEAIIPMHLLSLFKINKIDKLPAYKLQPEMRIVFVLLHLYDQSKLISTDLPHLKLEAVQITDNEIQNLLAKYFLCEIENPNFYKINNFLSLSANLLTSFKERSIFSHDTMSFTRMDREVKNVVFKTIIEYSREYTVKSVEYTISSQRDALLKGVVLRKTNSGYLPKKENEIRGVIDFHGIIDFSLIFDNGGFPLPVYKDFSRIPQSYREFLASQKYVPKDFINMKGPELINILCFLNDINKLEDQELICSESHNYVMTPDNFHKMCLIISKSRANIPIILMGEAGCGKTSLVKFLAEVILKAPFKKIDFHAGITPEKLRPQLEEIWKTAKSLSKSEKIWLFLDEINTSDTLGLVSEMLTSNSYEGAKLPPNIQYIAAVNPYVKRENRVDVGLVKKQAHQKTQQLAYTVHPLPESLLNFVWNFDQLNEVDEKQYILRMIKDDISQDRVLDIAAKCIVQSHKFIRARDGLGSVSLRDIKRFGIVYKWFYQSLQFRGKIEQCVSSNSRNSTYGWNYSHYSWTLNHKEQWDQDKVKMKAVILALAICYYIRFDNNDTRSKYLQSILEVIKSNHFSGYSSQNDIENVIEKEQNEYLDRMKNNTDKDLLRGIAFNSSLKENVFTMLVCLINRIPLIICGKPGCSKTLSFQLILNNLRGPDSKDPYFKTLPTLIPVTYQGSLQSSSDGIIRVFAKAQRVLDDSYDKDHKFNREIISVVFFDEMGLAELSRNNPLKVLHSLLEYETDGNENSLKKKVAFVGISNWKLDVSKMSRAVFLARPELDAKNLKFTARSIMESFNSNLAKIEWHLDALSDIYSEFVQKQHDLPGYSNFHGLRDFYSLIKGFCALYIQDLSSGLFKLTQIEDVLNLAIERNFGGAPNAAEEFKKLLKRKSVVIYSQMKQLPVLELIRSNFEDPESRYLMLITKGNFGPRIISNHLKHLNKKFVSMVGSKFDQDIDQEEYSARTLSSIINCLEDGTSIIMQGLDNIYPSLYDLFNQNFTIVSKKKTSKIALGTTNNSTCTVDEGFRCIILLDENYLPDQDPPFLNRFEKQIIGWDSILTDTQMQSVAENVKDWLKRFCESSLVKFVLPPHWLIINFTEENIASLVAEYWDPKEKEAEIIQRIRKEMIRTASVDLIAACCDSKGSSEMDDLINIYYEQPHQSLEKFIRSLEESKTQEKCSKSIVYTYSTLFEPLDSLKDYEEFPIASIYSERDLDKRIKGFYEKDKKFLVIRMKAFEDDKHFDLVKFRVERLMEQLDQKINYQKHLIVLIHINRRAVVTSEAKIMSMTYIRGWNQMMVDSLGEKKYVNFSELLELTTEEILRQEKLLKTADILRDLIGNVYLKINFKGPHSQELDLSEYIRQVANILVENEDVKKVLFDKICRMVLTQKKWQVEITTNTQLLLCSKDLYHAVRMFFGNLMEYPLLQIIYTLEQRGGICSLLKLLQPGGNENDGFLFKMWQKSVEDMDFNIELSQQNMQNVVTKSAYTRVPFSFEDLLGCFDQLNRIEIVQEYRNIAMKLLLPDAETEISIIGNKKELLNRTEMIINDISTLKRGREIEYDPEHRRIFRNLLRMDTTSIFVLNFLKCDERFGEVIQTIMKDMPGDEDSISGCIIGMIAFQRIFATLVSLAQKLWRIYPYSKEIPTILEEYENSKALNTDFTPFEHMLNALVKNFYPSEKTLAIFGSWKQLYETISDVILHVQVISSELTIWTNASKELKFWRDLLDIWLYIDATQIQQEICGIVKVRSREERDFPYQNDCYIECCNMFEALEKRANIKYPKQTDKEKVTQRIFILFSDYLLSCYEAAKDDREKAEVVKRTLLKIELKPYLAKFLATVISSEEIIFQFEDISNSFVSENPIIDVVNESLQKGCQDNGILVHLESLIYNDHVLPHFTKQRDSMAKYLSYLWLKMVSNSDNDLSLDSLTKVAVLKFFTQKYCLRLFETNNLPEKLKIRGHDDVTTTDAMEKILENNKLPLPNSLRIFALKHLSELYGDLYIAMEFNNELEWIKLIQKSLRIKKSKVHYPGFCGHIGEEYLNFLQQLKTHIAFGLGAETSYQALIDFFQRNQGKLDCLEVFYRELYWEFSNEYFDGEERKKWGFQNTERFEQAFGQARTRVLTGLLNNFNNNMPLVSLSPNKTPDELQLSSVINHVAIAIISKISNGTNPNIYDMFITKGNLFEGIVTQLQKSFLPGVEDSKMSPELEYLNIILQSGVLNDARTTYNKCECGFYYFIGDCGRPNIQMNNQDVLCLRCGKPIGGKALHVAHPGQQKVDKPTPEMIQKQIEEYITNLPPGYFPIDQTALNQPIHTIRDLQPITYRILSFILHSLLYYVIAIDGVDPTEMKKFLQIEESAEQYLRQCLESHWEILTQQLNLKQETYIFLHSVVDGFLDSISNASPFKNATERNQWESKFECAFLTPMLREMAPKVHEYKTTAEFVLQNIEETKEQEISLLPLIHETVDYQKLDFKIFPYLCIMRITEVGSLEGFENTFRRANMETLYPFTNLFLQVKDQVSKISPLREIVAFTNHVSRQLDRMVTREEAISKNVLGFIRNQSKPQQTEKEFKVFTEAWSQIKDIAVRYACKELPPKEFSDRSELVSLLPSNSIEGGGLYICAAFQGLAEIQNEMLQKITSSRMIEEQYPYLKGLNFPETFVQDVTPENLLLGSKMREDLDTMIKSSCYTEVEPGRGKNVIYDWKGAEECLMRNFLVGKRRINYEKIRMVQFKGELSQDEETDIVRRVRVEIPQKELSPIEFMSVSRYLETKNNDYDQFVDNLYRSLSILISYSIKSKMKGETTLNETCKTFHLNSLPHNLSKDQVLKDTKLCNIIHIFELVEEKGYPMIVDRTHQKFKTILRKEQEKKINEFIQTTEKQKIDLQVLVAGVKRFVGRYLDEALNESHGLQIYLSSREGLWPSENYNQISDFLDGHFPNDVYLENSVQFVKYVIAHIKTKEDQVEDENRKKATGFGEENRQTIHHSRNQPKKRRTGTFRA